MKNNYIKVFGDMIMKRGDEFDDGGDIWLPLPISFCRKKYDNCFGSISIRRKNNLDRKESKEGTEIWA